MASKESEQYRRPPEHHEQIEDSAETGEALRERKEQRDADVDDILAEIDDVLEENAEEFVRGFVQKGGQ